MLQIDNITKKYIKGSTVFTALEDVSFQVDKGDFWAVVGASGSGKSTLLNTIGGLIRPDSGRVLFKGENIYEFNNRKLGLYRKERIGFVFQQFHLMPYLSVSENIKLVCEDVTQKLTIDYFLDKCEILPLKNKYPSELSVGEKQRTAFVRAIISQPDILLADEPTGNLDPENSVILMSLIEEFHQNGGTVLMVSHNRELINYATKHITLKEGKLLKTKFQ